MLPQLLTDFALYTMVFPFGVSVGDFIAGLQHEAYRIALHKSNCMVKC
jgi:hypothetical protein